MLHASRSMMSACTLAAAAAMTLTLVTSAQADVIYTAYNADTAGGSGPATAAGGTWTASNTAASPTAGGALSYGPGTEPVSSLPYWNVTDTAGATAIGGSGTSASQNYSKTTTAGATSGFTDAIATTGWIATATMKVTASTGAASTNTAGNQLVNDGTFFDVRDGHRIYTLGLLNDSTHTSGLYYLPDGSNAAVGNGTDSTSANFSTLISAFNPGADYFTLKLIYAPNPADPTHTGGTASYDGDIVDVYLNDTKVFEYNATTDLAAATAFANPSLGRSGVYRELLGSAAQGDIQTVNYRYFDLQTTPEPASLAVLGLGAAGLIRRQRRA